MDQMFFGVENAKNHEEFRRKVRIFHRIILLTLFVFCISTILFTQFYLLPRYKNAVEKIQVQTASKTTTVSSKDESMGNWKTYTDRVKGYSLQYPPTWTNGTEATSLKLSDGKEFSVYILGPYHPSKEENILDSYKQINGTLINRENITLNGYTVVRQNYSTNENDNEFTEVIIQDVPLSEYIQRSNNPSPEGIVILSYEGTTKDTRKIQHEEIFNKILTSFKFLEKDQLVKVKLTVKSQALSPDGKKILAVKTGSAPEDPYNTYTMVLTVLDISGANEIVLRKRVGDLVENWFDVSSSNWSLNSQYVFYTVSMTDAVSVFVFKANGQNFSNGKNYIDSWPDSQYSAGSAKWISDTKLQIQTFRPVVGGKGPTYILDAATETFTKINN